MLSISGINDKIKQNKKTVVLAGFLLGSTFGLVGCDNPNNFKYYDYKIYGKTLPQKAIDIADKNRDFVTQKLNEQKLVPNDVRIAEQIIRKAELEKLTHEIAQNPNATTKELNNIADQVVNESLIVVQENTDDDFELWPEAFSDELSKLNGVFTGTSYNMVYAIDSSDYASREIYDKNLPEKVSNIVNDKKIGIASNLKDIWPEDKRKEYEIYIEYSLKERLIHELAQNPNVTNENLDFIADKLIADYSKLIRQYSSNPNFTLEEQLNLILSAR